MSNLTLGESIDLNTVSISVWFRVPTDAAEAVQARDGNSTVGEDVRVMDHVVPIIMFGAQQSVGVYERDFPTVYCEYPPFYTIENGNAFFNELDFISGTTSCPIQPTCIGVQCFTGQDPTLYVHIQPSSAPNTVGTYYEKGPGYSCGFGPPAPTFSDSSFIFDQPQYGAVGNSFNTAIGPYGGTPTIELDHWHHLLISWQLNSEGAVADSTLDPDAGQFPSHNISGGSFMYCVLDGVSLEGINLPATWVGTNDISGGADPHAICCAETMDVASSEWVPNPDNNVYLPDAVQTTSAMGYGVIPATPLSIPGPISVSTQSRGIITANQHIEMAELQIYSGRMLTDGEIGLFLDGDGKPVDPKITTKALGLPTVLLHKSSNWIKGKDTGTDANLVPEGTILKYLPDPSLHGPQSPADLKK